MSTEKTNCSLLTIPFNYHMVAKARTTKSGVRFSMNATGRMMVHFIAPSVYSDTCVRCFSMLNFEMKCRKGVELVSDCLGPPRSADVYTK